MEQSQFLCNLYRQHDTSRWPKNKKTIDLINGLPDALPSKSGPKPSRPSSLLRAAESSMPMSDFTTDVDSSSDNDDDMNYIGNKGINFLTNIAAQNALDKDKDKSLDIMDNDKEEADDDDFQDEEKENGKFNRFRLIKIDAKKIDFTIPPNKVAKDSMQLWLSLCDSWTKAIMSDPDNVWLAKELYLDPIIAVYIGYGLPLLQYHCINLRKLYASSNSNMPSERGLKYPKACIGIYSHKYDMNTVEEFQHINERQLNEEYNRLSENEFNEVPFIVKSLIEVISLQVIYKKCDSFQKIYNEACKKTDIIRANHKYWSYVNYIIYCSIII